MEDKKGRRIISDVTADPDLSPMWDKHIAKCLPILFPKRLGKEFLEWGCSRHSLYLEYLEKHGYVGYGYDLYPQKNNPRCFQLDLRDPPFPLPPKPFLFTSATLMYFTLPELLLQLQYIWRAFSERAYLSTPHSGLQAEVDPQAITFVDPLWLAWQCRRIGGTAIVLNFNTDQETALGPAIYWSKSSLVLDLQDPIQKLQNCLEDELFSVTLL